MWVTLLLGAINLALSFSYYLAPVPGMELTPAAMVLIAHSGESIFIGAIVMTLTYMIPQPKRFSWVWLHFPSALLCGYLALHFESVMLPVIVYAMLSLAPGLILGLATGNYVLFVIVNTGLNLAIVNVARMLG